MNFFIPDKVQYILDTLINTGFKAYIVGGCVRDTILMRIPKDYDITTSAKPDETIKLFEKTIPTGIKHGTVTVMIDGEGFEVTTFRMEGEYKDNRHPSCVDFVEDVTLDLSRRDFTINAMAYNHAEGLIDPFGGLNDSKNKVIRCVGDSTKRFQEDALRMMRAIRFSSELSFSIKEDTLSAISDNSMLISKISAERIRDELTKMLISPNPYEALKNLKSTGLLKYISPDLDVIFDEYEGYLKDINLIHNDINFRMCFLLLPIKNLNDAVNLMKNLRMDNKSISFIAKLYSSSIEPLDLKDEIVLKTAINDINKENIFEFLDFVKIVHKNNLKYINLINNTHKRCIEIIDNNEPLSLKDLKIDGTDIKNLGIADGRLIGKYLTKILHLVMLNPSLNNKDDLEKYLLKIIK